MTGPVPSCMRFYRAILACLCNYGRGAGLVCIHRPPANRMMFMDQRFGLLEATLDGKQPHDLSFGPGTQKTSFIYTIRPPSDGTRCTPLPAA